MESIGNFEYNTRDMLGHGAFAMVYKGRYKKNPEKEVAVKRITKKNLARSQNLLKKEIKILQELTELHHENVVSLLDCKETPQYVYLVMEYCNGGDLMDYLNLMNRTLSEDTIRIFIRQIAAAMKALQAKGIVHRDLKPQNILLCYQSQKDGVLPPPSLICLKIADFGFARFLKDGVMAATLCGSPMYMAPEVIMSLQYDAKADLWSIATIIYQCLTGAAPFKANTPQELKLYYEQSPNLAPLIPKSTSPELTDLLTRLLRRNAKDRMDFDDFFSHPFILSTSISSSPSSSSAASSSTCHSCDRAPSTSPSASSASALQQPQLCSPVASPVGSSALPRPSSITSGGEKYNLRAEAASSRRQHPHARVAQIKEEDAANAENIRQQQQQPSSPRSSQPTAAALGQSRPKSGDVPSSHHHRSVKPGDRYAESKASAGGSGESSGSSGGSSTGGDTFEDFVMINEDVVSTITATAGGAAVQPSSLPQRIIRQALRPLGNYMPEPLPVPTQRAAYEAIQRSSGSNTSSIGVIQESAGSSSVAMLTSPPATPPSKARFGGSRRAGAGGSQNQPPPQQQPQEPSSSGTMNLKRHDSCSSIGSAGSACSRGSRTNMLLTDVSNMSPPSMNFVLGSSGSPTAAGGIVSSSNIASMNRSRRLSVPMSPGPSISPSSFFNCQSGIPYNTAPCCGHSYGRSPGAEHVVSHGQHQHQQHQHQQQQQSQHPPSPSNPSPLSQMLRHSRTDPSLSSHLTYFLPSSEGALRSHFGSSRTVDQMSAAHQHQQQQQFSGQQYRMSMPSGGGGAAADGGGGNNGRLVHRHHFPNSPAAHPYFQQMQTHVFSCCAPGQHAAVPSGSQIVSPSSPTWSARNFHHPYGGGPSEQQNTITFEPPGELSEETLLDKGHNETLAKLNFVLALVDSIFEYINSISSPMAVLSESIASDMVSEEKIDKVRFVLYLRCLQLLTSALKLSQKEINSGRLWTSNSVRSVVKTMRDKYRKCLDFCKDLNRPNIIKSLDNISADKLLYEYAIKMCQSGAIEEIVGVREESFKRYQTAQILLHSLSQQAINEEDRNLLNQYREAVEKRMFFLQNQGVPILLYNQN